MKHPFQLPHLPQLLPRHGVLQFQVPLLQEQVSITIRLKRSKNITSYRMCLSLNLRNNNNNSNNTSSNRCHQGWRPDNKCNLHRWFHRVNHRRVSCNNSSSSTNR